MEPIPVSGPWITQKEIDYVTDAVTNAWYSRATMYHDRFEAAFARYTGRAFAIALPSCTSALHLALASAGVGPGDEVIVPDCTWIATAAPISYLGAEPVFADIDPRSWCLDLQALQDNITTRTKAVIAVDLYGNIGDMDAISDITAQHGIAMIEDAAEAAGSTYKQRKAGSFGLSSTFSFHGSKTLTTGEGGMLLTDDGGVHDRCLFLRDHGRLPGDRSFWFTEVAYKYRMSSMQAALGLAQLERIDELIRRKREIFAWYASRLQDCPALTINQEPADVCSSYWMVTIVLKPELGLSKEQLSRLLAQDGISCRPFFYPLSAMPAYAALPQAVAAKDRNTNAYSISAAGLNLPCGFNVTEKDVAYICERLLHHLAAVAA